MLCRAISVLLGEAWKSLPAEDRQGYSERAKLLADEQKKLHPDCWKRKRTMAAATGSGGGPPPSVGGGSGGTPSAASKSPISMTAPTPSFTATSLWVAGPPPPLVPSSPSSFHLHPGLVHPSLHHPQPQPPTTLVTHSAASLIKQDTSI